MFTLKIPKRKGTYEKRALEKRQRNGLDGFNQQPQNRLNIARHGIVPGTYAVVRHENDSSPRLTRISFVAL